MPWPLLRREGWGLAGPPAELGGGGVFSNASMEESGGVGPQKAPQWLTNTQSTHAMGGLQISDCGLVTAAFLLWSSWKENGLCFTKLTLQRSRQADTSPDPLCYSHTPNRPHTLFVVLCATCGLATTGARRSAQTNRSTVVGYSPNMTECLVTHFPLVAFFF